MAHVYKTHFFCSWYLTVLINVIVDCDAQWNVDTISSPSLPRGDFSQAVGFYNDTIYLLGGSLYGTALVKYIPSTNIFTDEGSTILPFICAGHSQHYTQINNKLYWITADSILYSYHFPTKLVTAETNTGLNHYNDYSCLTSYNNLIFVLGGWWGIAKSDVTVYNTASNTWISSIESMMSPRRDFCCATDAKRSVIYSIGGFNPDAGWMKSIETLVINNVDITESLWSDSDPLMYGYWGHRAVYIEADDSILVIRDTIQRIDCETGAVSFMVDLNYDTANAASIYTDTVLYVFGGYINSETGYDTWLRITNPLILGSSEPTISPTEFPSSLTLLPSKMPTAAPSFPTKMPSHAPLTSVPSKMPTEAPIISVAPTLPPITATDAITTTEVITTIRPSIRPSTPSHESSTFQSLKTTDSRLSTNIDETEYEPKTGSQPGTNNESDTVLVMILSAVILCLCGVIIIVLYFKIIPNRKLSEHVQNIEDNSAQKKQLEQMMDDIINDDDNIINADDGNGKEHEKENDYKDLIDENGVIRSESDSDIGETRTSKPTNRQTEDTTKGEADEIMGEIDIEGVKYEVNESGANQVRTWLSSIGQSSYFEVFIRNGFDSLDLVKQINDIDVLKAIGISLIAHQLKILNEIKKL